MIVALYRAANDNLTLDQFKADPADVPPSCGEMRAGATLVQVIANSGKTAGILVVAKMRAMIAGGRPTLVGNGLMAAMPHPACPPVRQAPPSPTPRVPRRPSFIHQVITN